MYEEAAEVCPKVARLSSPLWQQWIHVFSQSNQLSLLIPLIPTEPPLSPSVYEMTLSLVLLPEPSLFKDLIPTWRGLYHDETVLQMIEGLEEKTHEHLETACLL